MRIFKKIALPTVALLIGLGMGYSVRAEAATTNDDETPSLKVMLDLFQATLNEVSDYYVEPLEPGELVQSALKGMLNSLDPYSDFMTPKDMESLNEETSGQYSGVGMQVGIRDGWPTVIAPFDGSPAYQKGLRPGDKIIEIEGESTYDMSINDVVKRLRGTEGTEVTIKVAKPSLNEPVEITLTRAKIKVHPVPFYDIVGADVGYVKLTSFSDGAADELMDAIDSLNARGARGLILDLRGNPGGLLREAVNVSDLFLPKQSIIVSTKGRGSQDVLNYFARNQEELPTDMPVVVLVDNGSASASEIVAGALQDWDRALILGDTTFGKGLVQRVFPLSHDYAIRLTTSRYYTPSGRCINRITRLGGRETRDTSDNLVFYTKRLDREVKGGGGIIPDIVQEPEKLHTLTAKAISEGALFSFAVQFHEKHKKAPESGTVNLSEKDMDAFRKFLQEKDIEFSACEWEESHDQLKYWLQQDIAEKYWSLKGRYRQSLVGDPLVSQAVERIKKARTADDLFQGTD